MAKVIPFKRSTKAYDKIAHERLEKGDLIGALSCFFSSLKAEFSLDTVKDIAITYSQMTLYDLSNKYWFIFLSKSPKIRYREAYEGLAVNLLFTDNVADSNYYFRLRAKCADCVGDVATDNSIEQDLNEIFEPKKIKLVYPVEQADYSDEIKEGTRAIASFDSALAIKKFKSVPKGCKQYVESLHGLVMAYYIDGDFDKSLQTTKEIIDEEGENTGNLCRLSQIYNVKAEGEEKNKEYHREKAKYYYNKAKLLDDKTMADTYKLVVSAFENKDDETALSCMEKIIAEKKYHSSMNFYYAISLLNNGQTQKAYERFSLLKKIMPFSEIVDYYLTATRKIINTGKDVFNVVPADYSFQLPDKEEKRRLNYISKNTVKTGINKLKGNSELLSYIKWGLNSLDSETEEKCAFFLMNCDYKDAPALLKDKLLDVNTDPELKRSILYHLIYIGEKEKLSFVINNIFCSCKPQRLECEKEKKGDIIFAGYALALSTLAVTGCKSLEKMGRIADEIYKKFVIDNPNYRIKREEIGALIIYLCDFNLISRLETVCFMFDIKERELKKIVAKYKGEKND